MSGQVYLDHFSRRAMTTCQAGSISLDVAFGVANTVSVDTGPLQPPIALFGHRFSMDGETVLIHSITAAALASLPRATRTVCFNPPVSKFVEPAKAAPATAAPSVNRAASRRIARIRPPADVIKLEDRLYYLLQPPVDAWMAGHSLEMPCHPFPYQLEGVAFLYPRLAAILADEMGLGKTMQAITALRMLLRSGEIASALVVCPKPLVANWLAELHHWAPEIPCIAVTGDQEKRQWQWGLADVPIKIANYELLVRDRDAIDAGKLAFDLVVLDEAQRIKNRTSATAETVCSVQRRRSWALTGTPVENRGEDLSAIFEFLSPGYIPQGLTANEIGRFAAGYILRRRKEEVLSDLPPKLIRDALVELGPQQREAYRLAEEEGVLRFHQLGALVRIQHVFELVLRLKQICNFDPASGESSKLERLEADLEEVIASGQKAIVFSQWVATLDKIARQLSPSQVVMFHGGISHRQREQALAQFRSQPDCHLLLMTYGAGGVGLNLQCASYVFLFDRWWNPAVEDQAINRAHRIGAVSPVTVTRFLVADSIEERIDTILDRKRQVFNAVLESAELEAADDGGLSRDEIFNLFDLRCPQRPHLAA